jgi:hypothetical protein
VWYCQHSKIKDGCTESADQMEHRKHFFEETFWKEVIWKTEDEIIGQYWKWNLIK